MRIVTGALIGLALFLGGCQEKKPDKVSDEKMTLDQVPPKVREAVHKDSDMPVESINRHEVNGNVVYSTTVQSMGKWYDLELDSDGRLLRRTARTKAP